MFAARVRRGEHAVEREEREGECQGLRSTIELLSCHVFENMTQLRIWIRSLTATSLQFLVLRWLVATFQLGRF